MQVDPRMCKHGPVLRLLRTSHQPLPSTPRPLTSALHTQERPTSVPFLRLLFIAEMSSPPHCLLLQSWSRAPSPPPQSPPALFRAWAPAHRRYVSV